MALALHLLLPDFDAPEWTLPRALHGIAAAALLLRPCAAAFALALAAKLWPLLLLRDVLTQSMFLAWSAAAGLGGTLLHRLGGRGEGALDAVRFFTAGTYLLAALHKLNRDFLDPDVSCAQHVWRQVAEHWQSAPTFDDAAWLPASVILLEVVVGLLVLFRSPLMWPLGVLFHLPITLTIEPAFGAVMFSGYVAATDRRHAALWRRVARERWPWLAGAAALAVVATAALHGRSEPPLAMAKMAAAGALALGGVLVAARRGFGPAGAGRGASIAGLAWGLHGLTPYAGLQFQHTAAMLSNLRIDPGCHNSFLFPEALRLVDPYLRIDEAGVGTGRPERERILRETLWNFSALHTMRANWCIPENRPIRLAGTWRGGGFDIPDLCADDWWSPFPGAARVLPGFQALQKNLPRACPSACIH